MKQPSGKHQLALEYAGSMPLGFTRNDLETSLGVSKSTAVNLLRAMSEADEVDVIPINGIKRMYRISDRGRSRAQLANGACGRDAGHDAAPIDRQLDEAFTALALSDLHDSCACAVEMAERWGEFDVRPALPPRLFVAARELFASTAWAIISSGNPTEGPRISAAFEDALRSYNVDALSEDGSRENLPVEKRMEAIDDVVGAVGKLLSRWIREGKRPLDELDNAGGALCAKTRLALLKTENQKNPGIADEAAEALVDAADCFLDADAGRAGSCWLGQVVRGKSPRALQDEHHDPGLSEG